MGTERNPLLYVRSIRNMLRFCLGCMGLVSVISCGDGDYQEHGIVLDELNRRWAEYASESLNQELIDDARPVLYRAIENGDWETAVYAGAYMAQAFSMIFCPDSMYYYINLVEHKAEELDENWPIMVISNTVGVYNLIYSMNYSEALHYFYEALDHCDYDRNRNVIMWNIVNICYLRRDTTGLEYAREIFQYGKDNGDDYFTYIGALACSYMLYEAGDLDSALHYVEMTTLLDAYEGPINNSDALHGNILADMHRNEEAELYYKRAVAHSYSDYSALIESYLSYGQFLKSNGRLDEAVDTLQKGLALMEEHPLYFWGHKLYNALAETYSALGRNDLALDYIRQYYVITDSIFNIEKERAFENLRRNYERQKQEIEIQQRDINILKEQRKGYLLLFLSVILGIVAAASVIMMRRKSNMYKRLVKSYNEFIMLDRRKRPVERTPDTARLKGIFDAVERLMREEYLFRNSGITVDSVAKAVDTNRLYLSKAINQFAEANFNDYVRSYRIRYAVSILSDVNNTKPIKAIAAEAGYNNLQSFYNNFQKETGVPPSKYRQEIIKLKKE